jgi:hypothetical protein
MQKQLSRYAVLGALTLGTLAWVFSLPPIPQDPGYHLFADIRRFAGIPNGMDVLSSLAFLFVGIPGLRFCLRGGSGAARPAWLVFFAGVTLVSIGSAWYHWNPSNVTLLWDRLPMTVGFMGLVVALLGEYVAIRLVPVALIPAIAFGVSSVLYWHWTDDLRLYAWVQFFPLLLLPVVMLLFRSRYTHQWLLPVALGWYILAKFAELNDGAVFQGTQGLVGGHTVKHLLAAACCYTLLVMLRKRRHLKEQARDL